MKKIYVFWMMFWAVVFTSFAQDTISVVQYNLTYYGRYNDYCTESNNNVQTKTEYLKTIVSYLKPDIFGVNEITDDAVYHDYLLNNVFLLNGFGNYRHSQVLGSYLTTQIFYNSEKLVEKQVISIPAYPRYIYIHRLYFRTAGLQNGDTVFLNVVEAHLKAGNTADDAQARAEAVYNLMDYIGRHPQDNYLFMGDFNLYSSSEQAYQNAVNPTNSAYRFYDPGPAGDWSDNAAYAQWHTQSTNYYSNDCFASGGLDDRFDFILYTAPLKDGTMGLKALSSTFKVIGQDGQHFNSSVDYNGNTSVPADVLTALKNNSDHLPIFMELYLDATPAYSAVDEVSRPAPLELVNTLVGDQLILQLSSNDLMRPGTVDYAITDLSGKQLRHGKFLIDGNNLQYTIYGVSGLQSGIYLLKLTWDNKVFVRKFVKN